MSDTSQSPASNIRDISASPEAGRRKSPWARALLFTAVIVTILVLYFGLPWWFLVFAGADWPTAVEVTGTVLFAAGALLLPVLMYLGHGRRLDWAARFGDTLFGVVGVLLAWSLLGNVLRIALALFGIADPTRARIVVGTVIVVVCALLAWGYREAMRVPRVRYVDIKVSRLGAGLDGTRIVLLTDTHYGPIDRVRWSQRVIDVVNSLDADIACHTGDIADGSVAQRRAQADPLANVRARLARAYVTGNHEYFGEAQSWIDHMSELGWESLHNRHMIVQRGGDQLVIAGIDDRTARRSGTPGHGADLAAALRGVDPDLPVLLLAHQPKQITQAAAAGVDVQISGHTHGGQIWPFHFLVRLDQPVVQGLSRHGERTHLYTSRGTGFWGPPFRIFAPSEISVLTLRRG